ncbi:MAG: ABC transporter permease [Cellvibrionaceae bacterium]
MSGWFRYFCLKVSSTLELDATKNYLGFFVWVVEPALLLLVFYLVFGVFLARGGEGFVQFLLVGIVSWLWVASSVGRAMNSLMSARQLICQVYVPKIIFPLVELAVCLVKQLIVFALLFVLLLFIIGAQWSWLFFPLVCIVQLLLIAGVSLWVAAIVPFIPDLRVFIPPGLQMLMFCSGVFYSVDFMPESVREYFLLNPVANLLHQYRTVLIEGSAPDFMSLLYISIFSLSLIISAVFIFKRYDRHYPRVVY